MSRTCSIVGCTNKYLAKGYCGPHYNQIRTVGQSCKVSECTRAVKTSGFCERHYSQMRKFGKIISTTNRTRLDLNEINIICNVAKMKLYDNFGNEVNETNFDINFVEYLKHYKWSLLQGGYVYSKYEDEQGNENIMYLHRAIMFIHNNFILDDHVEIDHKDLNPLNNMLSNLRIGTSSQNKMNRIKRKNCSSQYKGVSWRKDVKMWEARIQHNGKPIFLGLFIKETDAARAYNVAAIKYFGEFARLNDV